MATARQIGSAAASVCPEAALPYTDGILIGETEAFQPAIAIHEPQQASMKEIEMVRKYEILGQIPKALAAIDSDVHEAHRYRAGDPIREGLILAAAETAYGTLVGLTQDALLWMALQRQVLVKGWQFEDLQQLNQLTCRQPLTCWSHCEWGAGSRLKSFLGVPARQA
jgi:hypothetical protein